MGKRTSVRTYAAVAALLATGGVVTLIACADVGTTTYGDPGRLRSQDIPGEGGTEAVVCGDAAVEATASAGCSVSFKADIYPSMKDNGAWKCASAGKCHGATQAPLIDAATPGAVIDSLKGYAIKLNGVPTPYINQDGGDPSTSTFECNVTGQCGAGMPLDPGRPLSKDDVCRIDAWLRCGAPNN